MRAHGGSGRSRAPAAFAGTVSVCRLACPAPGSAPHSRNCMTSFRIPFLRGALPVSIALCVWLSTSFATQAPDTPPHWELSKPAPAIALKPPSLDKAEENKCASCHADIVQEWASTAHAIAWVDEEYQAALVDRSKPQTCYGCHIPKPLLQGDLAAKPAARED